MNKIIKHQAYSLTVGQREVDGFVNATALCQAAGKKWNDYFRLKSTQEFLDALASEEGLEVVTKNPVAGITASGIVQVFQGVDKEEQGTWIHPQVAIHLAMWLSPQFSVLVTKWVMAWNFGKGQAPAPQPERKALGPSKKYPEMTQEVFNSLPYLDQIHAAEDEGEEWERRQRERKEKTQWEEKWLWR